MKKIAVVILNWNGCELMRLFLPSVLACTPSCIADVIVADNASTDNSIQLLKESFPAVKVIQLDKNYGFAGGYNRALKQIEAKYVVLLNSDVEVTPGWLDAPVAALDADINLAAVQPKLLAERNRLFFEYAGASGGFLDKYGYPFCRGRIFSVVEADNAQYNSEKELLWATGACLIIRKDVYMEAGGLDDRFFAHQEEIDLCWRLKCRGYRIVCMPQSVVYHVGGATLNADNPRKTFLNFRNNLLMLYKNLPEKALNSVFRFRFFSDYVAACVFLLKGEFKNARAVYRARKAFFEMKNEYKSIREENLRKTVSGMLPEIYNGSILYAFYLKRKKTFAELM